MPYYTRKGTSKKDKGKTCVYKKEDGTKVGCTAGPVEKYLAALHIHESKDFEWLSGPVTVKFADIKNHFYDYMSVGDTIHLSGLLMLSDDLNPDPYNSILLNMEPVVVLKGDANKIGQLNVKFNENIINQQVWLNNTDSEWLNLGSLPEDDELIITLSENKNITESEENEFDWIHQQEPEKELNKNKSYVIDVTDLRPTPIRHSHDTSLTRQDILRKFDKLGYDVDGIDVEEAKYFYIEPHHGTGWKYNDYGTPIEYSHWVDYNDHFMEDPTYEGKYQLINVDELMFLLNNNLISESDEDMSWLTTSMGEPMSICDAQLGLNPGDNILINELPDIDNMISGGRNGEVHKNINALVLAVDDCNKIQPDNSSNHKTILIHVNDDYNGFSPHWVSSFANKEHKQICSDRRCIFLFCGGDDEPKNTKITKLNTSFLGESENNGLDWVLTTNPLSKIVDTKDSITESAGISFEVRDWSNIVYNEIMSNPQEKTRLIIDGYDHPEVFDGFPIDYVVVDFHDKITGYDHVRSGYDKDGNYVVILFIQPQLIQGIRGYDLKSGLNHEFKHAYEDYQRRSKGKTNIDQTKESKDFYTQDFIKLLNNQQVVGPIKDILKYYYYVSNIEKSAFLENVYDNNPEYETTIRDILAKDFETFKNRYDLDLNWHLVNVAYDIPIIKKFKSAREFIDYSAVFLRKKALKILKKINKMKYIHGKV